jgi:hypothetical protein
VSVPAGSDIRPTDHSARIGPCGCIGGYVSSQRTQRPCGLPNATGSPSRARTKARLSGSICCISRASTSGSTLGPSNEI